MADPNLIAIDTSIVIDHLRKRNKQKSILFEILDSHVLHVPAVVEFELFAGATDTKKQQDVRQILLLCEVLPLTSEVARLAGELYRQLKSRNQLIEIRDLFIASTALVHELPLMTTNVRHFQRIESLAVVAPSGF